MRSEAWGVASGEWVRFIFDMLGKVGATRRKRGPSGIELHLTLLIFASKEIANASGLVTQSRRADARCVTDNNKRKGDGGCCSASCPVWPSR